MQTKARTQSQILQQAALLLHHLTQGAPVHQVRSPLHPTFSQSVHVDLQCLSFLLIYPSKRNLCRNVLLSSS